MVHIAHPTVFSLPEGTYPLSGGPGPPELELFAELFVMCALSFHGGAGSKAGLFPVKRHGKEADAAVQPDHPGLRTEGDRVSMNHRDRDMQVIFSMPAHKLCRSENNAFFKSPPEGICPEWDTDPSRDGVHAEEPLCMWLVPYKGIVSVPDKADLGHPETGDSQAVPLLL